MRRPLLFAALALAFAAFGLLGDEPHEARAMVKVAVLMAVLAAAAFVSERSPPRR